MYNHFRRRKTTHEFIYSPWKAGFMRQHNIEMNWRINPVRSPKVRWQSCFRSTLYVFYNFTKSGYSNIDFFIYIWKGNSFNNNSFLFIIDIYGIRNPIITCWKVITLIIWLIRLLPYKSRCFRLWKKLVYKTCCMRMKDGFIYLKFKNVIKLLYQIF